MLKVWCLQNTRAKKLISVIKDDLERLVYFVNYKVVNAPDYGVTQNGEHMILVALRKNFWKKFEFPPIQRDKSKVCLIRLRKEVRGIAFHMRIFLWDSKELRMIWKDIMPQIFIDALVEMK